LFFVAGLKAQPTAPNDRALYDAVTIDPPCNQNFPKGCMVFVPGGSFQMGAQSKDPNAANFDAKAMPHEAPVHTRNLESYWMHMREVSVGQYQRCVDRGVCSLEHVNQTSGRFNYGVKGRDFHPMNGISWEGAQEYCAWLGGRLPTEAEWEYASRGYVYTHFPWGNEPTTCQAVSARAAGSGCVQDGTTDDQKTQSISPFWIWDMSGSVWEWTSDRYDAKAYQDPSQDRAGRTKDLGPRVIRGGGWMEEDFVALRTTHRGIQPAKLKSVDVGFRCVRDNVAVPVAVKTPGLSVTSIEIPGRAAPERVRIWTPPRFRLPVSRDNITPTVLVYINDAARSFDDSEYEALLNLAKARGWFFVQPELLGYRGVAPGCEANSTHETITAILDELYKRWFIKRGAIHIYGAGSGGTIAAMYSRVQAWRVQSVVSETPVYNYVYWLEHQLKHAEATVRDKITSCWGEDSGSLEAFKRNKERALKFNRGGTQKVRHLVVAPVAANNAPDGWASEQALDTFNWLIKGTVNHASTVPLSSDARLQALVGGTSDGRTQDFAINDRTVSVLFTAKMGNIRLILTPKETRLSAQDVVAFFEQSAP